MRKVGIFVVILMWCVMGVIFLSPNTVGVTRVEALGGNGGLGENCRPGIPQCDGSLVCSGGTCVDITPTPGGGGGVCVNSGGGCSGPTSSQCCSGLTCGADSCDEYGCSYSCMSGAGVPTPTPTPISGGGGPTATRTPTPGGPTATPTIVSYTISGNVFVDKNNNAIKDGPNGTQDPGETICSSGNFFCYASGAICAGGIWGSGPCWYDVGEQNYTGGATLTRTAPGPDPTTTTNGSGNYIFSNIPAGIYNITLTLPSGYVLTTPPNPVARTVGPNATANFGISDTATPTCTSVTAPASIGSGQSSAITANGCAPAPTYSWPTPVIIPSQCSDGVDNNSNGLIDTNDPLCHSDGNPGNPGSYLPNNPEGGSPGSNSGGTASSTTYTAPSGICTPITTRQSVVVSNSNGSTIYNKDMTVTPRNIVSGSVLVDSGNNSCASGATAYTGGANIGLYSGASPTNSGVAGAGGAYTITDTAACGNRSAVISNIPGFTVKATSFDGAPMSTTKLSGYTYGQFDLSANHTLNFCISNNSAWIQTTTGDVRYAQIPYSIPAGRTASTNATNPSVFFSSGSFDWLIGSGTASPGSNKWTVNKEYTYDDGAKNANGGASYSFYRSRATQKNVVLQRFSGCPNGAGDCTITSATSIPTGVYSVDGNLTINSYNQTAGAHVLILVSGTTTINNNIVVSNNANNLLIIASKGNISISSSGVVGATQSINGIFTSEGDIIAAGSLCAGGSNPDKQLIVGGTLVANSRKPFATNGSGSFINNRSLCLNDLTTPSITVDQRLDFLIQLSDFYKTSLTRFQELNP